MAVEGIFSAFKTTLGGLRIEMKKLEAISQNVANAERGPGKDGKIYKRKMVIANGVDNPKTLEFSQQMNIKIQENSQKHINRFKNLDNIESNHGKQELFEVVEMAGEKLVYNPAHPRANAQGYVTMPNVNMVEEMVDLMAAGRAYEANINVMNAGKKMAQDTLKI